MRYARLMGPGMMFLGAMLIGCGDTATKKGGGGNTAQDGKKAISIPSEKLVSLKIDGMTGATGVPKAERALKSLPWVDQKTLTVRSGEAEFGVTEAKAYDENQLKDALSKVGYSSFSVLKKPSS